MSASMADETINSNVAASSVGASTIVDIGRLEAKIPSRILNEVRSMVSFIVLTFTRETRRRKAGVTGPLG